MLAQIVQMVAQAQRRRAPIQRLAVKVASWFVPAVIAIAAGTFVIWALAGRAPRFSHAIVNAVAVLIIACPCALGLATPMSIMVGVGRGAQAGVLIKNAEAIELMEKVRTLVVDKTGTLTEGHPRLTRIISAHSISEADLLMAAASVEQQSEHPFAAAIVSGARERGIKTACARDFRSTTGGGVLGRVEDKEVLVGQPSFLHSQGINGLDQLEDTAAEIQEGGESAVFVAIGGRAAGILFLADSIKQSTPAAIEHRIGLGSRLSCSRAITNGRRASSRRSSVLMKSRPE